jgi:Flp pilus assembly protein TadG
MCGCIARDFEMGYIGKIKLSLQTKRNMRGVAVVEFALLIFLLLIVVAGIVEFGRAFWYYDALNKATRDGARFLSMTRVSTTIALDEAAVTNAETMVKNAADMAKVPNFLVTDDTVACLDIVDPNNPDADIVTDCSTANYIPDYVKVSVAYPLKIGEWIPFVTLMNAPWNVTLSSSTTMRYMCSEPESC